MKIKCSNSLKFLTSKLVLVNGKCTAVLYKLLKGLEHHHRSKELELDLRITLPPCFLLSGIIFVGSMNYVVVKEYAVYNM